MTTSSSRWVVRAMNKGTEAAIRAIVALPLDDWQPEHWDTFEAAQACCALEVARIDRTRAQARTDRARREEGWWKMPAARKAVKERSGGLCELGGDGCMGRARDIHHVYGRRGPDPHRPDKLLHLCGHGNLDGCHGLVHSRAEWRERAEAIARANREAMA